MGDLIIEIKIGFINGFCFTGVVSRGGRNGAEAQRCVFFKSKNIIESL